MELYLRLGGVRTVLHVDKTVVAWAGMLHIFAFHDVPPRSSGYSPLSKT